LLTKGWPMPADQGGAVVPDGFSTGHKMTWNP
jgi:hypothetical protein